MGYNVARKRVYYGVYLVFIVKPNPSIVLNSDNKRSERGLENAQNYMRCYDIVEVIETNQKIRCFYNYYSTTITYGYLYSIFLFKYLNCFCFATRQLINVFMLTYFVLFFSPITNLTVFVLNSVGNWLIAFCVVAIVLSGASRFFRHSVFILACFINFRN